MEDKIQHIKQIAQKYFEGSIELHEEKRLLEFVQENAYHRSLFRKWESEWYNSFSCVDEVIEKQWNKIAFNINARESAQTIFPKKNNTLKYIAIAASLAVVFSLGAYFVFAVNNPAPPRYFTIQSPYGQKSCITLSDGSIVWLNSGSTLTYTDKFGKKNRDVQLIGEAYFQVEKHKRKFIVKTSDYEVEVKGTKFNVTAYPQDDYSSVTLLEGSIDFLCGQTRQTMCPGEQLKLDKVAKKIMKTSGVSNNAIAWTENRIAFDDIELKDLARRLSREFNKEIVLKNSALGRKKFSISISGEQTIEEILRAIGSITPMKQVHKNDTIQLM